MRLFFLLFVLWFSSAETRAQKQRMLFHANGVKALVNPGKSHIASGYDADNHIFYDTAVVDYNPSLADTFAFNQLLIKLPKSKADYVYYYSQPKNWPAGLVSYFRNHDAEKVAWFLNNYAVAYYFTGYEQFEYNAPRGYFQNFSNTKIPSVIITHLIEIPAAENTNLPDSMKLTTDIYLPYRAYPIMDNDDWALLGITSEKKIKKAGHELAEFIKSSKEKVDTALYFKTTTPVKELTADMLLQQHHQYTSYLHSVYAGFMTDLLAKNKKEIDKLNEGLQAYKNLLSQAIDAYRDNCAWLMKAYNNKEYDKILLFSKWKVGFKFTGNSSAGINGPHLYGNADHTLVFETKNDKLRMNSHVVTSGIGDELDTQDKKVGDVFQDFDIWGDFNFAGGKFTPLPGQNMATFTHYTSPPFDLLPKYFFNKKVNGLLDADFTFVIDTSGIYDYPVPMIILNGEKFALKWTYGDEFSSGTDLFNAEIDKLKKHIAELEKQ